MSEIAASRDQYRFAPHLVIGPNHWVPGPYVPLLPGTASTGVHVGLRLHRPKSWSNPNHGIANTLIASRSDPPTTTASGLITLG
jgi:hypothetical protein